MSCQCSEKCSNTKAQELEDYIAQVNLRDNPESCLIAVLHRVQELYGYLSKETISYVAREMRVPLARVMGVATFYHYFKLKPRGKYVISVCLGTACYVKGAPRVMDAIKKELAIGTGETTPDMFFTLQETRCLGACGLAPAIMINDRIYGELTAEKVTEILEKCRSGKI
jgi:NADH-quinone oxidoreductase E subunit